MTTKTYKEIWKPVVGYEDLYEISSYGKLKRLASSSLGYKNEVSNRPERIIKSTINRKGYLRNDLYKHDYETSRMKRKCVLVHRLVAAAFIGEQPKDKPQVNHKNGIKTDNHYSNLEWCDNYENQMHARKMGLRPPNKKCWDYDGSKSVQKIDIKTNEVINTFGSSQEAGRMLGICSSNIRKVVRGERKNASGYIWRYIN